MDNTKTGALIRTLRTEKGLTQKQLAERLHITDRAVSKWERGLCAPDLSTLEPLAAALDCTLTELITGERGQAQQESVAKEVLRYSRTALRQMVRRTFKRAAAVTAAVLLGLTVLCLTAVQLKGDGFSWTCIPAYWKARQATAALAENDAERIQSTIRDADAMPEQLERLRAQGICVTGWRAPLFRPNGAGAHVWLDDTFLHFETELFVRCEPEDLDYRVVAHGTCRNGKIEFARLTCGVWQDNDPAWLRLLEQVVCTYDPG